MVGKQLPVLLLTGYLGSGKTTLVNRMLSNRSGIKFAVIVNDIGEVNIDADLIQKGGVVGKSDESLVALQNGCICCTLKVDLINQIRDIALQDRFDYLVIEASGICEPEPIAQSICTIPQLARLDSIVTVVDALRLRDEFGCGESLVRKDIGEEDLASLVIQQIEFCNVIVLNKASEVLPEELNRIRSIVKALQPAAQIIDADWCDIDMDRILDTKEFDFDKVAASATWIHEVESHHDHHEDGHHHDHEDEDEGEAEEYGISTFVYYRRPPLDLNCFDNFVAKRWPSNIIRAKGICYFSEEFDTCYVFEQAGRQMSLRNAGLWYATMPEDELQAMMEREKGLAADWDPFYGDRMIKLVFIGQHLDRKAIEKELDLCLGE
ncbi:MAG: GTP-binding protein [Bacteroidales bacterium]|nr:GTP-binding protein [Candidatus Cacconaster caballi]